MKNAICIAIAAMTLISIVETTTTFAATKSAKHSARYFDMNAVKPDYSTTTDAVILGGTPIMVFRVGDGGYSAHARAIETQDRFNAILGMAPIFPGDVTTSMSGADAVVLVKGQLLFTADPQTAAINGCDPIDLASTWAEKMRDVLPRLTAPN